MPRPLMFLEERLLLELEAWRQASRQIDISEYVRRITPSLARLVPLDLLMVRLIQSGKGRIETVAAEGTGEQDTRLPIWNDVATTELARIAQWHQSTRVIDGTTQEEESLLAILCPPGVSGQFLAVPLVSRRQSGVLLLRASSGTSFHAHHLHLVRRLNEPFAAALENDRPAASRSERVDACELIIGMESGLKEVMVCVQKVAATDAPVLILGETGSGKNVIAHAIHARSPRADGPFVRVDCGAIPADLVEAELVGLEDGSFSGTPRSREGWFERADGGALFLDEIRGLPAAAQARLLRILHDRTFERVGGGRSQMADVRLVAATHCELEEMSQSASFRQDLWYRMSVFPIRIPPLRDRLQDVPALARHFAAAAGKRIGGLPLAPIESDLELLLSYSWPGNIRELAAVIERAAILGEGRRLEVSAALGLGVRLGTASRASASVVIDQPSPGNLADVMRDHIERALAKTRGQIEGEAGAARSLGINPHTLRAKMRKLGIEWQRFRVSDRSSLKDKQRAR